jgi:hypothetical protein
MGGEHFKGKADCIDLVEQSLTIERVLADLLVRGCTMKLLF